MMALNPNVVVVAPGEVITAAHLNNIRSNLDRIDQLATLDVETRTTALTLSGAGLTTTPITVPNALALGTRGTDRLIIVTAGLLTSGAAAPLDMYAACSNTSAGTTRRTRFAQTVSGHITAVFYVAASVAGATASVQLGVSTGSATVSTTGSADLNYLQVQMIPINTVTVIP